MLIKVFQYLNFVCAVNFLWVFLTIFFGNSSKMKGNPHFFPGVFYFSKFFDWHFQLKRCQKCWRSEYNAAKSLFLMGNLYLSCVTHKTFCCRVFFSTVKLICLHFLFHKRFLLTTIELLLQFCSCFWSFLRSN